VSEATAEVRETLSLSLRLRVARARATGDLFGKYSVFVRYLFGSFSEFVRSLPLVELDKRYDYAGGLDGVDENMSIDQCLHSVFGASKVAADVMCQEFGRYFQMPVGIFRGGCLTGPQHAAVELHGYLAYIVECAVAGKEYTIYGYKGKQVRDQIHSYDVAHLFLEFFRSPRCGEVYNLGGGRTNSLSILETVDALAGMGLKLRYTYKDTNRVGDHICYISDLSKVRAHFPHWKMQYDLPRILDEIAARRRHPANAPAGARS
jgi:CDP-paratose 2-epimerase